MVIDEGSEWTYQAKADGSSEAQILIVIADLRVGKEERHGNQGTDDLESDQQESLRKHSCCHSALTIVPRLPQKNLDLHMKPARMGLGILQALAIA